MRTISATVRNGVIVPDGPVDWPDGAAVAVTLSAAGPDLRGLTEEEQGATPEAIRRWLDLEAATPPPVMTDEEWAAWQADRAANKARELAGRAARDAAADAGGGRP